MNEYKTLKICKYLFVMSICTFVVSLFVQVYTSNNTALKGKDFLELHEQKAALEKEIAYLQYEDSTYSSLASLEIRAGELGFIEMTEPLDLIQTPSLASLYTQ